MKTLMIAEKPSVARDIAAALNVPKSNGCYENDELIISHCIGHLIEFDVPELQEKNVPLPIFPTFALRPKAETAEHYQFLCQLIHRQDVSALINACDADRAGEHIFRLVYQHSGCLKPVKRMWIQSTTKDGLCQAFENLKDSCHYDDLAAAEQCRAEADWLLGINGSRAIGNDFGRVMTPTLAMVVDAFQKNQQFKPSNYWEVVADFVIQSGTYQAKLIDNQGKVAKFDDESSVQAALQQIQTIEPYHVFDESEIKLSHAPYLFDANELQKVANKKLGFAADKTLSIMQNLYEKHKVLTYPRSDFNALPEDYLETMRTTIAGLGKFAEYRNAVSYMQDNDFIVQNKRVFNDARVGSHYAIVPTGFIVVNGQEYALQDCPVEELMEILPSDEYQLFQLVVLRTLAAFYPAAEYGITTRLTKFGDTVFKTSGRVLLKQGWLNVYGGIDADDDQNSKDSKQLPKLAEDEAAKMNQIAAQKLSTKAPPILTESGLIQAMKTAGRDVDNQHLADLMKEIKGIGTSATRAPTIAKLKKPKKDKDAYMSLVKNKLIPSQRALDVIAHVRRYFPQTADPILTAEWEDKLQQMEHGQYSPDDFRNEIKAFVTQFVQTMLPHRAYSFEQEVLCACPNCDSGSLKSQKFTWNCECGFKLYKEQNGRVMSTDELRQLAETGKTDVLQDFVSKEKGTHYAASLQLKRDDSGNLKVALAFPERKVATCPCCLGSLNDKKALLECECSLKLWKTVAGKALTEQNIQQLLDKGKTSLINGLTGKSGKVFSAYLVLDKQAKQVKFEFPPRS